MTNPSPGKGSVFSNVPRRWWIVIAALSIGLLLQQWQATARESDSLQTALEDLEEIREKIRRIRSFADAPQVAALAEESPEETTDRIDAAMRATGLSDRTLQSIAPGPTTRVDRTDFVRRGTVIDLTGVTLKEMFRFAEKMAAPETGAVISAVRILPMPERNRDGREQFEVEMTLTQTIYFPIDR